MDISPDGRWLVFDSNNDIQLYDLDKRTVVEARRGHQAAIRGLQFSRDGRRLGSVSADRTLKPWSVPSGEIEFSAIAHRTDTVGLAFTPDGRRSAENPHSTFDAPRTAGLRCWFGHPHRSDRLTFLRLTSVVDV